MTEKHILVTYSSKLGSTQEIAEAIGCELKKTGHAVDVADMKGLHSLDYYQAVIIGVPVYAGPLGLGDIGKFVRTRFRGELARLPVAIFAVGLLPKGMKSDLETVTANLKKAIAPIVPVSTVLFAGTIDSKKLSLRQRFATIAKIPSAEFQDWGAIRSWARKLPCLLSG